MIDRSNRENNAAEQPAASSSTSYHPRYLQKSSITQDNGSTVFYEVKSSRRRYQKKKPINKEEVAEKSIIPHSSASRFAMARQKYMQQQHKTGMTNAERSNLARNSPSIFGRSGNSPSTTGSAGIAILLFSLTGIIFLFLLFYFLSRLCTTKPMTNLDERSTVRKGLYKFNTMALDQYSPQTVLYPKRIYELQAEEGLFSGLPQLSLTHETSVLGSASLINPILSMIDFEGKEQWLRSLFQRTQEIEAIENDHGSKLSYPYGKVSVAAQTALQCGRQLVRKLTGIELDDLSIEKVEQITSVSTQPRRYLNPEFVKS